MSDRTFEAEKLAGLKRRLDTIAHDLYGVGLHGPGEQIESIASEIGKVASDLAFAPDEATHD